ncbi:unnamed protein product [Caenorhabditis brenneri]
MFNFQEKHGEPCVDYRGIADQLKNSYRIIKKKRGNRQRNECFNLHPQFMALQTSQLKIPSTILNTRHPQKSLAKRMNGRISLKFEFSSLERAQHATLMIVKKISIDMDLDN